MRLSMLGMLALISAVLLVQAWQDVLSERLRQADAEIIGLAGSQRLFSQRLTLLALQNASEAAPLQLRQSLAEARKQAQRLELLLQRQGVPGSDEIGRVLATARLGVCTIQITLDN